MAVTLSEWSTAVIALATVVYVVVTICLWKATKRSADAARSSADAAKLSAEALVNSERAWLVLERIDAGDSIPLQGTEGGPLKTWFAVVTMRNCGKTVALLRGARVRFHTVSARDGLPTNPEYGPGEGSPDIPENGRPVAPGETFQLAFPFEGGMPSQQQVQEIRNGSSLLFIYGRVEYADLSGRPRESQFCYNWHVSRGSLVRGINDKDEFRPGGPRPYNSYT